MGHGTRTLNPVHFPSCISKCMKNEHKHKEQSFVAGVGKVQSYRCTPPPPTSPVLILHSAADSAVATGDQWLDGLYGGLSLNVHKLIDPKLRHSGANGWDGRAASMQNNR